MGSDELPVREGRGRLLIIHDQPERVGAWVAERTSVDDWGKFTALGLEKDGELVAGVVYNHYTHDNIVLNIASDGSRRWAIRAYLFAIFHYPFVTLGLKRITVYVASSNKDSLRFCRHIGCTLEGTLREVGDCDLHVLGMLRRECRWLGEV